MSSIEIDPALAWILRASLATLFAAAAMHKIRDPQSFIRTFAEYDILPRRFSASGAIALVAAELSIATGLLIAPRGIPVGFAAVSLLLIYSLAIIVNLIRGRLEIDCGCLGPASHGPASRQPLSAWLVVRNGVLILGAAATSLPISNRSLHFIDGFSLLGGFLTLALLFNAVNVLAAQSWLRPEPERLS